MLMERKITGAERFMRGLIIGGLVSTGLWSLTLATVTQLAFGQH